jgi:dimethylamine monooxygenase subunit A
MTQTMTLPRHTPYDGSTKPFTIGLGALDPSDWIEKEADPEPLLLEKDRLWQQHPHLVFAEADDTRASQSELLSLLVDHLLRDHGDQYRLDGKYLHFGNRHIDLENPDLPPLKTAGSLVADDLLILRRKPEGWTLVAATLSFPSSWSLADKFGRTMDMIHAPVPGFEGGTRNAELINRMFDNLHTPVWRRNWSLNPTDALYLSKPKEGHNLILQEPLAAERIFMRIERQSLRKLPQSGDIVFSIRIHIDPLSSLLRHPQASACLSTFADQLENLEQAQRSYKGLAHNHQSLVDFLRKASLQP